MNYFKRKAPPFILGLLLGIVIAGTFFILRLDTYFKELNFYKNLPESFSTQQTVEDRPSDSIKANSLTKIKNKKQKEESEKNKTDEAKPEVKEDSAHSDDISLSTGAFTDNIVIRKDELLNVRTIELKNLDALEIKSHTDSLLDKLSDIKDDNHSVNRYVQIEFWRSPLNYKGYKLSKYSVILYGLPDIEEMKLYNLNKVLYIKNASTVYKLEYNRDFKPFERVVDESILSNFK
ncbi:MAG TPA: hypothetical protein VFF27_02870 [Bacteroidia bacterium]|jgi:hypothetical protein|nr:hypothetical protein [Bacteroidia bacterium]